jgi:hypothetical protein
VWPVPALSESLTSGRRRHCAAVFHFVRGRLPGCDRSGIFLAAVAVCTSSTNIFIGPPYVYRTGEMESDESTGVRLCAGSLITDDTPPYWQPSFRTKQKAFASARSAT